MEREVSIKTYNLNKQYKDVHAVNQLNLTVYKGDVYGFLGPNGAGKSTTIRMLLGLISPTSGRTDIFGLPFNKNKNRILKKVGALVEKPDFYNYLSAYKNLEILSKLSGLVDNKNKIMEVLELVGLKERYKSKVKTFSQGMRQRLGIAQTLIHDPELIILDEPGNGLDPQGTKDMRNLILSLNKNFNKTILISSHILHEIEMISNRMIILNNGSAVIEGDVKELLNTGDIKISFEVDNSEKAKQIISNSFKEINIELINQRKFILLSNKEKINEITKTLVNNKIEIHAVVPARTLEEYFLDIT